jgi:hypothetical protein
MADRTWKRREREVANTLGGRRIPVTGERCGADVLTPRLAIQVKYGRRRPAFLREWLSGIQGAALASGRTGVVVWSDHYEATSDAVAIVRLSDLASLMGETVTP